MPKKNDREYRSMTMEIRKQGEEPNYKVSGYASTFEPYVLFNDGENDYYERLLPDAFAEADLSDVIFLYNHTGMVYARQKNGTLTVNTDDHGLKVDADLSSTTESRQLYESINSGLIDQMSFAFTVREESYDPQTRTRTIHKIDKVYDVSAVSIPANPTTELSARARDFFDGVIEKEKAERLEREKALALAKAKYFYEEV